MPAMHFTIRWPDGEEARCYSPSTIVREFFAAGLILGQRSFFNRIRAAGSGSQKDKRQKDDNQSPRSHRYRVL